jgi:hypothetical protein
VEDGNRIIADDAVRVPCFRIGRTRTVRRRRAKLCRWTFDLDGNTTASRAPISTT